jgi:hypothetical protein
VKIVVFVLRIDTMAMVGKELKPFFNVVLEIK